jgi:hypothetical protein
MPKDFAVDCLVWMLFNGSNLTSGVNYLKWNGHNWNIVNHFIPFDENEVGAPDRFESDFMASYLGSRNPSTEAKNLLDAGCALWKTFFSASDVYTVRQEFKLNRPDVGWYQVRNALKRREAGRDEIEIEFRAFDAAYKALSDKLIPRVYDLGFLRE